MFDESRSGSYSKTRYNIHRLSFDNLQNIVSINEILDFDSVSVDAFLTTYLNESVTLTFDQCSSEMASPRPSPTTTRMSGRNVRWQRRMLPW